jgi:hypothetical protein
LRHPLRRGLIVFAVFGLAAVGMAGSWNRRGEMKALVPSRATVEFGEVWRGTTAARRLPARNDSSKALRLASFRTSCDCVAIRAEPEVVPAGEAFALVAEIDLSHEPEYAGFLTVEVDGGPDEASPPAYLARINIHVRPRSSEPSKGE